MGKIKTNKEYFLNFIRLLKIDKKDITQIYIFAVISGVLSLTLPLGIQAVINIVITGVPTTSFYVLVVLLLIGVLLTGIFQIMQLKVTENIRQRLFSRVSFEFAERIPYVSKSNTNNIYLPEIMNRVFDVFNIQKSLPKVFHDISQAVLQIILGLILLSLYNTYFIFFGALVLLFIGIIFRYTWRNGILTGIEASNRKYKTIDWLEELARSFLSFKIFPRTNLHLNKTDEKIYKYLDRRREHYSIVIAQNYYLIFFKIILTAGLLIVGGFLVFEGQINLGQFVAAEIVIILIVNSVEKLTEGIESLYDIIVGTEKLNTIMELEYDDKGGSVPFPIDDYKITLEQVKLTHPVFNEFMFLNTMVINKGEKICLMGELNKLTYDFLDIIKGINHNYKGEVKINQLSYNQISKLDQKRRVASITIDDDIFSGSIYENLVMGFEEVTDEDLKRVVHKLNLDKFINRCTSGIDQVLTSGAGNISKNIKIKLLIGRALLSKPEIIVMDDIVEFLTPFEKKEVFNELFSSKTTIVYYSHNVDLLKRADRIYVYNDDVVGEVDKKSVLNQSWLGGNSNV